MRSLVFTIALIALPAVAGEREYAFDYPDDLSAVRSPSGGRVANFHRLEDENHLRFAIQDKEGKELAGFAFLRSVDGAWADASDNLFVNDRAGSNSSDCLILTEADGKMDFASLRAALNAPGSVPKEQDWIKPAQLAENAHYYLLCERWAGDTALDLVIEGHTGAEGGAFKYLLRYDTAQRAFSFRPK